ncbi:MAG: ribosome silencing factor [Treponema sp.]|jgi:ribosome-associated protein|nr:ribosome silencing factor [Treponema sp.]
MARLSQETELRQGPDAPEADSRRPDAPETVKALCALLEEHRAGDVVALDLRELHSWTDYFIIATVTSGAHRDGLLRHIKDFAGEKGLAMRKGPGKSGRASNDGWSLVDLGTVVIHLMSSSSRSFYELEQLWSSAKTVYPKDCKNTGI